MVSYSILNTPPIKITGQDTVDCCRFQESLKKFNLVRDWDCSLKRFENGVSQVQNLPVNCQTFQNNLITKGLPLMFPKDHAQGGCQVRRTSLDGICSG